MYKGIISIIFTIALFFVWKDIAIRKVIKNEQIWIQKNNKSFLYILEDVFDRAQSCINNATKNCTEQIDREGNIDVLINKTLLSKKERRQSIYFIRLKDDAHIEKLFQKAIYSLDTVDTEGEKTVVNMLKGKKNPFPFPLYTCNGPDDLLCLPFIAKIFPRIYLKDFYSEIEFIHLVRDSNKKILGAVISLYAD